MRNWLLCFAAILPLWAAAQTEQVDTAVFSKIRNEEFNRSQIPWIAHQMTDVVGPRLTNSPGYNHATAWAVETLKKWGLVNAEAEPWGEFGKGWKNEHSYLALKQPYYQPLIGAPVAWTNGTNGTVTGKLVVLEKLDSASIDAHKSEIAGNFIIVRPRDTTVGQGFKADAERFPDSVLNTLPDSYMIERSLLENYVKNILPANLRIQQYLTNLGAAAWLTSSKQSNDGTIFVQGAEAYAKNYTPILPQLAVAREDLLRLIRLANDVPNVQLEADVRNAWFTDDLQGHNVVAEIPGTDPKLKTQLVMLGGHLDSWHSGTGATDNGAGCIVMMEAVRLLKVLGLQPKRTIRIALWGGEEQGLLGSFNYVKKHFGDPRDMKLTPDQQKVSAYFNLDNGSGKIRGIYLQGNMDVAPIFSAWMKPFSDLGATGMTKSNTGATDHLSFDAVGIPGFQFIQDPLEYETRTHHSNMDVYDHLSIDDLKQAAVIVASFIYQASVRKDMLPRKPLPKAERFVFDFDEPY